MKSFDKGGYNMITGKALNYQEVLSNIQSLRKQ